MILYKYRSLKNLDHILDIFVHSRLYCARYLEMNDPFEGLFSTTIHISPQERAKFPFFTLPDSFSVTKSVNDLFHSSKDRIRICSLSSSMSDVRLWSHYADGNRGIVLEIDFSGLENVIHEVNYSDKLPSYGYTILTAPNPIEVLTQKTTHWSYESEFRIIHETEFFDIQKRMRAIYVGSRVSKTHLEFLDKMKPSKIPIIHTDIDPKSIEVRVKRSGDLAP